MFSKIISVLPPIALTTGGLLLCLACGSSSSTSTSPPEVSTPSTELENLQKAEELTLEQVARFSPTGEEIEMSNPSRVFKPDFRRQRLKVHDILSYTENLPNHYKTSAGPIPAAISTDNTPENNPISNEGAMLGRLLFYDKNLSKDKSISCGTCHKQHFGFSDDRALSLGILGTPLEKRTPALINAKFYAPGKFFWDERAPSLEEQVLQPIENPQEMGLDLETLVTRLENSHLYPHLFRLAFQNSDITRENIAKALSQFIRSMVSYSAKFDRAFLEDGSPNFEEQLSEQEQRGLALFAGQPSRNTQQGINCAACHGTSAFVAKQAENIGLAITPTSPSLNFQHKVPSLRNVAMRTHFMHDGRFESLRDVIRHYSNDIITHPQLSVELLDDEGRAKRPRYTRDEIDDLIAFLRTLDDRSFAQNPLFSNPFKKRKRK